MNSDIIVFMLYCWLICLLLALKYFSRKRMKLVDVLYWCAHFRFSEMPFMRVGSICFRSLSFYLLAPNRRWDRLNRWSVSKRRLRFALLVIVQSRWNFVLRFLKRAFWLTSSSSFIKIDHIWTHIKCLFWAFMGWSFFYTFLHCLNCTIATCWGWVLC